MSDMCARCDFTDYMQEEHGDWDNVSYSVKEYNQTVFGEYRVVESFFDPVPGDGYYGDGCHEQGHSEDVYMIFKGPGDVFLKVWGNSSSYGSCYWHGVKEVVGKVVEKVVYEFKES
jgi:hypothetical protein